MKIVIITGQTATGKTELAYKYAERLEGELINGDSRQVYKHLDIISGKDLHPRVSTHLYDIVDPKDPYSSYEWANQAKKYITKLIEKNKTPIIIGGSYLYLKHLLYGVETEGIGPDWKLRKKLDTKSVDELQQKLARLDPVVFKKLNNSDKNNPRRLIRKIEIANQLKNKNQESKPGNPLTHELNNIEFIGLRFKDRSALEQAIAKRVEKRIQMGALEEVKKLLEKGYDENDPGLKTIGYQQLIKYFAGIFSKDAAIEEWTTKEIQYARRQYTFMKKDPTIKWKNVNV